ncbi:hypothetical protein BMD_1548 [Priestia megaterium DSM 319]|uniref:Uncharacterized protein n=1 Tax=Priestia megaterium (strain DSM 319 / IMG 1521) TaxID=592022 RepID=D5DC18_PRIM3|nr:hypothetical protein BMD_1548 [Priestia megaterium DSM 319]
MKLLVLITKSMYRAKEKMLLFTQLLKATGEDQKLYELSEFVELF